MPHVVALWTRIRRPTLVALTLGGLALGSLPFAPLADVRAEDDWKAEKKRYERYMERPSLYMRQRGRVNLAKTRDVRALKILAKSYGRPEVPKDQVQYLLASICADNFRAPPHVKLLRTWRAKHAKPKDAWLWYRTLAVECKNEGPLALIAAVRSKRPVALRAAALLALAKTADENTLPVLAGVLDDLPAKPFDRAVLLETAAQVLWLHRGERSKPAWRQAAALLIPRLDDRGTLERTKLTLARRFAAIWRVQRLAKEAEPWLARLERRKPKAPDAGQAPTQRYAPPKRPFFFGIEGTGRRIAYVIDMSDSMLTPLTGKEVDDLRKTPAKPKRRDAVVTGPRAPPGRRPPGKAAAPQEPDDVDLLPWANIRTRFDAARAFLKLSLRGLGAEQSFCVIGFGSEASLLAATPGLRRATPANIEKVVRELDGIEAGPKAKGRPHGTLRGYTNMHGGLHRAFKVRARGLVKQAEYVDPGTFEDGCDTVFLLSDGKPTWDDWPEKDLLDPDTKSGDPESGAEVKQQKTGTFYGPYAIASWLLDDLRRLDLFRHVEIHCVGLGEYDPRLLQAIARVGHGAFRRIPPAK